MSGLFCEDLSVDPLAGIRGAPYLSVEHVVHEEFARDVRVVIPGALRTKDANAIERALARTPVVAHPHAHYPLRVAPATTQPPALARFTAWLRTPEAARVHLKLVGFEHDRELQEIQVQTSRMEKGERFPMHVDTHAEGIACIYHFSRLQHGDGGELVFYAGREPIDVVAPLFGSLLVFEPRGAPHEVREVKRGVRFSVTAFYLVV